MVKCERITAASVAYVLPGMTDLEVLLLDVHFRSPIEVGAARKKGAASLKQ